jgi:hypothetical protein
MMQHVHKLPMLGKSAHVAIDQPPFFQTTQPSSLPLLRAHAEDLPCRPMNFNVCGISVVRLNSKRHCLHEEGAPLIELQRTRSLSSLENLDDSQRLFGVVW